MVSPLVRGILVTGVLHKVGLKIPTSRKNILFFGKDCSIAWPGDPALGPEDQKLLFFLKEFGLHPPSIGTDCACLIIRKR